MAALLGPLLVLGMLLGIYRLLSPSASRSIREFLPRADREPQRSITGHTERRGAILAALAAVEVVEVLDGHSFGAALFTGIAFAICFRFAPEIVHYLLAPTALGLTVLEAMNGSSCEAVSDEHRALSLALVIGGIVTFVVVRTMFTAAGFARGDVTLLVLYGIAGLGFFVAAPFSQDLVELVEVGGGLTTAVAGYGLVVVAAAALPAFTVGVVGITLAAAKLSVDAVVQTSWMDSRARSLSFWPDSCSCGGSPDGSTRSRPGADVSALWLSVRWGRDRGGGAWVGWIDDGRETTDRTWWR